MSELNAVRDYIVFECVVLFFNNKMWTPIEDDRPFWKHLTKTRSPFSTHEWRFLAENPHDASTTFRIFVLIYAEISKAYIVSQSQVWVDRVFFPSFLTNVYELCSTIVSVGCRWRWLRLDVFGRRVTDDRRRHHWCANVWDMKNGKWKMRKLCISWISCQTALPMPLCHDTSAIDNGLTRTIVRFYAPFPFDFSSPSNRFHWSGELVDSFCETLIEFNGRALNTEHPLSQ